MTEPALEAVAACPLCDGTERSAVVSARDRSLTGIATIFPYVRCGACEAVYLAERPSPRAIGRFYADGYEPYAAFAPAAAATAGGRRFGQRVFERIARRLRRPLRRRLSSFYAPPAQAARLLDFGCGAGSFLDEAAQRGWQGMGMDFSEQARKQVEERGHEALDTSEASWSRIADASLGLVRLNHVIEHVHAPRSSVRQIAAKLVPGGRCHIATPNPHSLGFALFGEFWWGLECPRHLVLLPPARLELLLREAGFEQIEIVQEYVLKDLNRSVGIWLKSRGMWKERSLWSMAQSPSFSILTLPLGLIAWLSSRCDRYHVFATKKTA